MNGNQVTCSTDAECAASAKAMSGLDNNDLCVLQSDDTLKGLGLPSGTHLCTACGTFSMKVCGGHTGDPKRVCVGYAANDPFASPTNAVPGTQAYNVVTPEFCTTGPNPMPDMFMPDGGSPDTSSGSMDDLTSG